ncbi:hypothetical protein PILCRDRAFT_498972 [Piloderma croceum F 1598]|uniref:Uncharacterized protein n=1 Tax=Piloderma croceum (strain F 1598) TaxID=765440 RepID=A0A0C3FRD8_PILCF|nr:hypothetical protein PILCRDRAFT_498972 [Piloderma croceum F 1598]
MMLALQTELDDLGSDTECDSRCTREHGEELMLLERCEGLENERVFPKGTDSEIIIQLRTDMEGFITELSGLFRRNDELIAAKDSYLAIIRELDTQLKEYKRKYEQAKTELRSVKARSQLL